MNKIDSVMLKLSYQYVAALAYYTVQFCTLTLPKEDTLDPRRHFNELNKATRI